MKPPPFDYRRPTSLSETLDLLSQHGDDAKILAGGQSLLPMMSLRVARPEMLIDVGRVSELDTITEVDGAIAIGALVRHRAVETSDLVRRTVPVLHQAMPHVGHRAIRTRGTLCGSIAHADPAAEAPAVCLATGATMVAASTSGEREIAAADFFDGFLTTALRPDELLREVRFPTATANHGCAVLELSRRHGDYAIAGLACTLAVTDGSITSAALAFLGLGSTPVRVGDAEAVLVGNPPGDEVFAEAAAVTSSSVSPGSDMHATAAYRRHVAATLARQGLAQAAASIGASS